MSVKASSSNCRLQERQVKFVDIFRTTPVQTVCPNFFVLAHANGCAFAPQCRYCYLKSSFWALRGQRVYVNFPKMAREIRRWLAKDDLESFVLNTGNLSDSLSFEPVRPLMGKLIELFRAEAEAKGRPHSLLVVTKGGTRECVPFFAVNPCANVIISFSVNATDAARDHESGAAPVVDRLAAARRLMRQGWRVRMRIDPMILGYDYTWVIGQLRKLRPERVTLGTLRAEAALPKYTEAGLFDALEKPANPRGLARYPKAKRLALYRPAVKALKPICPMGLCEETPDVWDALGLDKDAKSCNCGS